MNSQCGQGRVTTADWRAGNRGGSLYIVVAGSAVLVSLIALTSLSLVSIKRRQMHNYDARVKAQINARTALDVALYRIATDALWRQDMAAGAWETDQQLSQGAYSFAASDDGDGDLADDQYDPLSIVGTGKYQLARYKLRMALYVEVPPVEGARSAMHAGDDIKFKNSTVTMDREITANHDIQAEEGSQVYADVRAKGNIEAKDGGQFHGSTMNTGPWPVEMPDRDAVLQTYLDMATPIDINDLPRWDANLLQNADMEAGTTSGWEPFGASTLSLSSEHADGASSIQVSDRATGTASIAQDVTTHLESGMDCETKAKLKMAVDAKVDMQMSLKITSTGDGERIIPLTASEQVDNGWTTLSGTANVSWTGTLLEALWFVDVLGAESAAEQQATFYLDATEFRRTGLPDDTRVINQQLLSPYHNPYGDGTTNPEGIYSLDADGKKVVVRQSRIEGTLILTDYNEGGTYIQDSVSWQAAVPNYPALLADKDIQISLSAEDLDESKVVTNFNPVLPASPVAGDTDLIDRYPSQIEGIVYSRKDIKIGGSSKFVGPVVAHDKITVTDGSVNITYPNSYANNDNAPGFRAPPVFKIAPGSITQVVD